MRHVHDRPRPAARVPGNIATTLREVFSPIVLFSVTDAFASSGTALKPRLLAAARSFVEIQARHRRTRPSPASPVIQPCTGKRGAGSSLARRSNCAPDQELSHHVPAVRRARVVVDDQRRRRALARGLLELVGPAPVIGHAPAFEQRRVVRMEARVVDEHDDRLALHVERRRNRSTAARAHRRRSRRTPGRCRRPHLASARCACRSPCRCRTSASRGLPLTSSLHRRLVVGGGFDHRHGLEHSCRRCPASGPCA